MSFVKILELGSILICICFGIFFCAPNALAQTDNWKQESVDAIKFQIALNRVVKFEGGGGRREMFLLIATADFTSENLQKIFLSLSSKYPTPDWLDIDVYDNKGMVERGIKLDKSNIIIHFKKTPEGRKAAEKWSNRFGPPAAKYLYADYFRIERENYSKSYIQEDYRYTPTPESTRMTQVLLRTNPGPPYSGDLNADFVIAVSEGDAVKVRALLSLGADVNSKNDGGDSALMIAVLSVRKINLVKILVAAGADVNYRNKNKDRFNKNQTALIYAASIKDLDIFKLLVEHRADINAQNGYGYSPLIMAVAHRQVDMIKLLLAKGANTDLRDKDGRKAIDHAIGSAEITILLENGN